MVVCCFGLLFFFCFFCFLFFLLFCLFDVPYYLPFFYILCSLNSSPLPAPFEKILFVRQAVAKPKWEQLISSEVFTQQFERERKKNPLFFLFPTPPSAKRRKLFWETNLIFSFFLSHFIFFFDKYITNITFFLRTKLHPHACPH